MAAHEGLHAALPAEQVVDGLAVKLVVGQAILAGAQGELVRLHERPQRPDLLADRAVARHDGAQIDGRLVTNVAAMASAAVASGIGHDAFPVGGPKIYGLAERGQLAPAAAGPR